MNAIARGVALALLALAGLAVGGAMDFHDGVERVVVDGGSAGPLRLYSAEARIGRVVVQISDAHGWTPADEILARDLAGDGALVVGVDLHALADENNEQTDGCHWISGMLENVGRLAERHVGLPRYRAPLLVGRGSGGMLAYGAAVEALEGMFEGAVAVKPVPTIPLLAPICLEAETTPVRDGRAYGPLDKGDIPVVVVDDGPGMPVGKGIERLADGVIGAARLRRVVADLSPTREQETIDLELPVVEMPVAAAPAPGTARDDRLVLLWSGDGGWRDIDVTIAEGIVAAGVPVVGIDSFSYFWHRRTPVEAARDLEAAIRRYADGWGRKRVCWSGSASGRTSCPPPSAGCRRKPAPASPMSGCCRRAGLPTGRFPPPPIWAATGRTRRPSRPIWSGCAACGCIASMARRMPTTASVWNRRSPGWTSRRCPAATTSTTSTSPSSPPSWRAARRT